jgi:hypothetical protein
MTKCKGTKRQTMINEILLGKQKIKQKNILKTRDHVTHEGKQFLLLQAKGNVIDEIISFLCFILHVDEI